MTTDPRNAVDEFQDAVRENVHIVAALAGASGSGKTKSALRLATGLAGPNGKIFVADTEARRALHYANARGENDPEKYHFKHLDMRPPFRPVRFEEVIAVAEAGGADVLIIDSFSHEYDGEGGIMDWANELEQGVLKSGKTLADTEDRENGWKAWASKPVKPPGQWKEPKSAHKHLVQTTILQARCHLIFCLRAEEKIRILNRGDPIDPKNPDGPKADKTMVQSMGWMPICEKRFMYEMTLSMTLNPAKPGQPDFTLPHKIQDQHLPLFRDGEYITEAAGKKLATWAAGTVINPIDAYGIEVRDKIVATTDHAELLAWWKGGAAKRKELSIPDDRLSKMQEAITARIDKLKEKK